MKIIPDRKSEFNYSYADVDKGVGGSWMEFDVSELSFWLNKKIFVPDLSLAVEYNGSYHYINRPFLFADLQTVQKRDLRKQTICKANGITLLIVPYWWDNTIQSVAQSLHLARPDIPVNSSLLVGPPIPKEKQKQNKIS